uniref:ORFY protein n=1 Tax=Cacao swollen shoot Togo B virus TaxID=2560363 RepID=A0A6G8IUH6_9VIRU|nr:ORFY protein [Cacao swollen shoot Togo B virus]
MEPVPESPIGGRRAGEVPASQLSGVSYPYSLAYDGLLQQQKDAITHGKLTLATGQAISAQLYRIEEQAAKKALMALRDLQGVLHFKQDYLAATATRDNWASDRLPAVRQDSAALDQHVGVISAIIERTVQP